MSGGYTLWGRPGWGSALVEAQLDRPCDPVVAADLGAAVATPEREAAEIELLRQEQRPVGPLPRRGELHRPCIG